MKSHGRRKKVKYAEPKSPRLQMQRAVAASLNTTKTAAAAAAAAAAVVVAAVNNTNKGTPTSGFIWLKSRAR